MVQQMIELLKLYILIYVSGDNMYYESVAIGFICS